MIATELSSSFVADATACMNGDGVIVVLSLVFPGFGHGLAERRARMAAFAVADLLATLGVVVTVWGLVASLIVRLIAAADAFRCARRASGEGSWGWAGVAVAIGAVGI